MMVWPGALNTARLGAMASLGVLLKGMGVPSLRLPGSAAVSAGRRYPTSLYWRGTTLSKAQAGLRSRRNTLAAASRKRNRG